MRRLVLLITTAAITLDPLATLPTHAMPLGMTRAASIAPDNLVTKARVVVHGGGAVGPRGAVYHRGVTAVGPRGNVYHRGVTVARPGGAWARPGGYWWRPGGAVAAGAALGFVAAATAAAWAGAAPGPNMCWYYTDPTQRQGFWDVC
jgi:hypothetical protein